MISIGAGRETTVCHIIIWRKTKPDLLFCYIFRRNGERICLTSWTVQNSSLPSWCWSYWIWWLWWWDTIDRVKLLPMYSISFFYIIMQSAHQDTCRASSECVLWRCWSANCTEFIRMGNSQNKKNEKAKRKLFLKYFIKYEAKLS